MKSIEVRTKIEQSEFQKHFMQELIQKPISWLLLAFGGWLAISASLDLLGVLDEPIINFPLLCLPIGLFLLLVLPLILWKAMEQEYSERPAFHERLTVRFSPEWVEVKGDSFESRLNWDHIRKVSIHGNWALIYLSKASGKGGRDIHPDYFIRRQAFSAPDWQAFQGLLNQVPRLRVAWQH